MRVNGLGAHIAFRGVIDFLYIFYYDDDYY